jgi:predicted transcriptional regulator
MAAGGKTSLQAKNAVHPSRNVTLMTATMREKAIEMIQQLPPEASVEEMMEKLYFLSKVERGLRQIDAGQVVSHEEAKRRFGR